LGRFANPSSDSIYQRIGYRAVSDVDFSAFSG
jgi:predicted GNAT family acetyltransferase